MFSFSTALRPRGREAFSEGACWHAPVDMALRRWLAERRDLSEVVSREPVARAASSFRRALAISVELLERAEATSEVVSLW